MNKMNLRVENAGEDRRNAGLELDERVWEARLNSEPSVLTRESQTLNPQPAALSPQAISSTTSNEDQ